MIRAFVLFAVLMVALVYAGDKFDVWQQIPELLFSDSSPKGLTDEFALGLATEATSFIVQLALVGGIFGFIADGRNRRNKRIARQNLASSLKRFYKSEFENRARARGNLPRKDSRLRTDSRITVSRYLWRYDRAIDDTTEEKLKDLHDQYEILHFETEEEQYNLKDLGTSFLNAFVASLKELKVNKKMRVSYLNEVRSALIQFSNRVDNSPSVDYSSLWKEVRAMDDKAIEEVDSD